MATKYHNLSQYDVSLMPDKGHLAKQRYAIVVADWNSNVTHNLLSGAYDALLENGVIQENISVFHVPGAFELIYAAGKLQSERKYNAIIVLGCVIQGETPHFDYVCQGVTQGVSSLNANGSVPVVFGLLTVSSLEQALNRAGGKEGNKGVEGAITAMKMANLFC